MATMVEFKTLGSKELEVPTTKYIQLGFHSLTTQGHFPQEKILGFFITTHCDYLFNFTNI
jgi:uncharacterized protein YwqG